MKITIVIKILRILFSLVYVALLALPSVRCVWFSVLILFIAILSLVKAIAFIQDSKLWLGTFLLYIGFFNIYKFFAGLSFKDVYMIYILIFGLASLQVFVVFRQKIHLKVFVFSAIEMLLLGILKFAYVSNFEFWYIQTMFIVYTVSKLSFRLANNFRR